METNPMVIHGWKYDFNSLPHWDIRDRFPYVDDALYENPKLDMAFLLYSITEYRMGCYAGFLAILKNKERPELLLRVNGCAFCNTPIVFGMDGKLAFAKLDAWNGGWPILIFDLPARRFACFETVTRNICFTVKEIERTVFVIVADAWQMKHDASGQLKKLHGTIIDMDALRWMPLEDIDAYCRRAAKRQSTREPGLGRKIINRLRRVIR